MHSIGPNFANWLTSKKFFKKFLLFINNIGIKHKLLTGNDMRIVIDHANYGDVILVRSYLEATNLLEGGGYTHAALKLYDNDIIEATADGVNIADILNLFAGNTWICIKRHRNPFAEKIVERAYWYAAQGYPYDYEFANNNKAYYCSELIYQIFDDIIPGLLKLKIVPTIKRPIIDPNDIYKNDNFETVLELQKS